ncbi:MAG: DUF3822 family protein [Bacteroidia bacterium]
MNLSPNISPTVFFEDESLKGSSLKGHTLFIQIGLDEFSFCLSDEKEKRILALAAYTFRGIYTYNSLCEEVEKIMLEKIFFRNKNLAVKIAIARSPSTLVPDGFLEQEDASDFLAFNHPLQADEMFFTDKLKNTSAKNIFSVPLSLKKYFSEIYSDISFHHHSTALIDHLLATYKNKSNKTMVVNIQNSHFEIIVLEENKLLFYNSFKHQTSEDFIYYLLFCCEQLSLNPEKIELVLVGEVEQESAIYSILHKYIRHVKFGNRSEIYNYSYKMNSLPKHFYYSLFSQYLCG